MPFGVRFTTPEDVPQCAALSRDTVALNSYESNRRVRTWQSWLAAGRAYSAVVVDEAENVVAFGLSVFISDGLRRQIRESGFHSETHIHQLSDHVLYLSQAIKAHRGEGLNLLGFYGWRTDLSFEHAKQLGWLHLQSFLYLHRGLHLKSFTKEVYGEEELSQHVGMGCTVFRTPEQFPDRTRRHQPYLVGADRQEVLQTRGIHTLMFGLFHHRAPSLHLENTQLELVQMAYLMGLSDEETLEVPEMRPKPRKGHPEEQQGNSRDNALVLLRQRWCRLYDKLDREDTLWHHFGRNNLRHDFLQYVDRHREVAFPVVIGRHFYKNARLAKRFPIPVVA